MQICDLNGVQLYWYEQIWKANLLSDEDFENTVDKAMASLLPEEIDDVKEMLEQDNIYI